MIMADKKPKPTPRKPDHRICFSCKRPLLTPDVPKGATRHCQSPKCDYCMGCVRKMYERLRQAGINR
jgi:hypothetical protein